MHTLNQIKPLGIGWPEDAKPMLVET